MSHDPEEILAELLVRNALVSRERIEALVGRPPFVEANLMDLLVMIVTRDAPRPVGVDPDLGTVVMKCLEKDPARRYESARALADDLGRWPAREPIAARPASTLRRLGRRVARYRPAFAALATVLAAAAVVAIALPRSRAATERARSQQEAYRLFEAARPALDEAERSLAREGASYPELVRIVERAQGFIEKGLAARPDLATGHYLGRSRELCGDLDGAEQSWRQAVSIDARLGPAHFRLGRVLVVRAVLGTITCYGRPVSITASPAGRGRRRPRRCGGRWSPAVASMTRCCRRRSEGSARGRPARTPPAPASSRRACLIRRSCPTTTARARPRRMCHGTRASGVRVA